MKSYPLPFRMALRLKGALRVLGLRRHEPLLPRLLFMGADPGDAIQLLSAIRSPEQWVERWVELGKRYESKGQEALASQSFVSAADALRLAAIYYRIAEYMMVNQKERALLWRELIRCYQAAGRLFNPPLEAITIACDGQRIPLYLQIPVSGESVPCIITLGGVDGVKEEWYKVCQGYLERGWACATLDLPGQGEMRRLHNCLWRPDPERIVSAVIDVLETYACIDPHRIILVGGSAGGYFALRAAAYDERLAGCALLSAPLSLTEVYCSAPAPIPQTIDYNLGSTTRQQSLQLLHQYDASCVLDKIHCPVWLVYGGADTTTPPHQVERIINGITSEITTVYYPDGDHICFNHLVDWQIQLHNWLEYRFRHRHRQATAS